MYVTGSPTIDSTVNAMVANWATIGVNVTASANTFNNLVSECTPKSGTQWAICWSGDGWTYAPNYYPSGEQLFLTNGSSNWGDYNNPRMNALIRADIFGNSPLGPYEQYASDQLPVLYMPNLLTTNETLRRLKNSIGWAPNALGNFLPEYLHF
jgi:peptide/nickel transport system substrate-binding protein